MATEEELRTIALSLPETAEGSWYGTPGFRVAGRGFLRLRSEAEGGLVVPLADVGEKQALLEGDPAVFFTTPHYEGHPVVLVRLPAIGVGELRELVTEAWRLKAPARVRRLLDPG